MFFRIVNPTVETIAFLLKSFSAPAAVPLPRVMEKLFTVTKKTKKKAGKNKVQDSRWQASNRSRCLRETKGGKQKTPKNKKRDTV